MKKIIFANLFILIIIQTNYSQRSIKEPCLAKCLIQDSFSIEVKELSIYNGDSWKDENSIAYEQIEVEGITDSILIVLDTFNCKSFYLEYYKVKRLIERRGYTQECKVICDSKIDKYFYEKLSKALEERGFIIEENPSGRIEYKTKMALVKFQKQNNLPIGQFDYNTLIELGLSEYMTK